MILKELVKGIFIFTFISLFFLGCNNKEQNSEITTVNIIALMKPKEGKADELKKSLLALVKPTHSEEGCIAYSVYEEQNGSLFLHEVWRSQTDLDKHLKKEYLVGFVNKMDSLLDGKNNAYFGNLISNSKVSRPSSQGESAAVYIVSIKQARESKSKELRNSLLSLVRSTLSEHGCLTYDIYEDDNGTFFMYEAWRSQEDLDRHLQQPYLKEFKNKSSDFLESNIVRFGKLISKTKD